MAQKIETQIQKFVEANIACKQKKIQTIKSKIAKKKKKNAIIFTPFSEVPFIKNGTLIETQGLHT